MSNLKQLLENKNLIEIFNKTSKVFKIIIIALTILVFAFLNMNSLTETTRLDTNNPYLENITYQRDNIIINIIIIVCFIVLLTYLKDYIKKVSTRIFSIILSVYTLIMGLIWVISVKSTVAYDSETIVNTAELIVNGDYSNLMPDFKYFYNYPFQLGYVFVCQIVNLLFKGDNYYLALQILNVLSLIGIFLALVNISKLLFNNSLVTNITCILLMGCVQSIMFTTFIYGNLLGFAFSMWAVALEIKYIKTDKKYLMLISAFLIGFSIMVKSNNMIILLAMCIILLIKFLDTKKLYDIVSIVLCVIIGTNILNVVISGYENKVDTDFGSGVPKILWLNMGIHESEICYGWYKSDYTLGVYNANNRDVDASTKAGLQQIKEQLQYFYDNPNYANQFFVEKSLSQWNEPTYSCIWVSETRGHTIEDNQIPEFVTDIYYNSLGEYLRFYLNQYQQIVFLMAFVTFLKVYKKKDVTLYIVPLILLGGFLYHLLFEGKSQYIMTYFILIVPMSAYGLNWALNQDFISKIGKIIKVGAKE